MQDIYYVICGECNHQGLIYDENKGELFCQNCGVILESRFEMASIPDILDFLHLEEKEQRKKMMKNLEWVTKEGRKIPCNIARMPKWCHIIIYMTTHKTINQSISNWLKSMKYGWKTLENKMNSED